MKAMFFMIMTYIVVIKTNVAMAMLVTLCGRNMSWFTHNYNLVPLFLIPPCATVLLMHVGLKHTIFKVISFQMFEPFFFIRLFKMDLPFLAF